MKLSIWTFFFQCGSQGIDPVAIRMFKHRVFEEMPSFFENSRFFMTYLHENRLENRQIVSYGPLHMSKYAEFRGEFDGDDENSSKLFRVTFFDEILFEKSRKIDISGVYPPLSYPHRGALHMVYIVLD